jgi:hypothetical protein
MTGSMKTVRITQAEFRELLKKYGLFQLDPDIELEIEGLYLEDCRIDVEKELKEMRK